MHSSDVDVEYWTCTRCGKELIDPDDVPAAVHFRNQEVVERKDHWLGPTEPICAGCAAASGIPSIDEE